MTSDDESKELSLDIYNKEKRIQQLESMLDAKSYCKRKLNLKKEFQSFLEGQSKIWSNAMPEDVRFFLVDKDQDGKTQVHELDCPFVRRTGLKNCSCPKRLAAGTISTLLSQLKFIFEDMGRKGDWVDRGSVKYGNRVSSGLLDMYIQAIKLEQAQAHVSVKQAKPLFVDKLKKISAHINRNIQQEGLSPSQLFVYLRDQAFFKLQFVAGDRAHDLSMCLAQEVRQLPNDLGLVFCHTVGKTLSNGMLMSL